MSQKYRYDHRVRKHRTRHVAIISLITVLTVVLLTITILYLVDRTTAVQSNLSGPSMVVGHISASSDNQTQLIKTADFTMSLPTNWHMISTVDNGRQDSITWQSGQPITSRYLTVYIDTIPTSYAVNRLLPVESVGSGLSYGTLSDNCYNFTPTASQNSVTPVMAKWQGINFLCNVPNKFDNQIGTGSASGINSVSITGPTNGTHNYFFLYIDRSAHPDYSIFYSILDSFRAK